MGFQFPAGEKGRRIVFKTICGFALAGLLFGSRICAGAVYAHVLSGNGTASDGKEEARQYGEYRQRLEEIEYKIILWDIYEIIKNYLPVNYQKNYLITMLFIKVISDYCKDRKEKLEKDYNRRRNKNAKSIAMGNI